METEEMDPAQGQNLSRGESVGNSVGRDDRGSRCSAGKGNEDQPRGGEEDCNGGDRFPSKERSCSMDNESGRGGQTNTLYVSNLPPRCGPRDVRSVFEEIGEVQDCRIISNPVSRESRGFAFVTFVDPSNAAVAIERLDGKAYIGDTDKPIRVERAKRNKPHNPTPGYYKGPPGKSRRRQTISKPYATTHYGIPRIGDVTSGASIKYDRTGRLKPGFLPYYAVAPGTTRDQPPGGSYGSEYSGGSRSRGGRWADDRDHGRGGYDSYGGGRHYDRYDHGPPRGAYDYGYDRGSDSRGYYDSRGGGYDRIPADDRAPYDGRQHARGPYSKGYDGPRGDPKYQDYGDYYGGNPPPQDPRYEYGRGDRDGNMPRDRSRSRGRRDRRRSISPIPRHYRNVRR